MNGRLALYIAGFLFLQQLLYPDARFTAAAQTRQTQSANVNKLGIYGDGKTDVTAKIQQAALRYKSLYFPKGNYVLSHSIQLASGNIITGIAGAGFTNTSAFTDEAFFIADDKSNISISKVTMVNKAPTKPVYALLLTGNCGNISISNITARQCGLLHTRPNKQTYRQAASNTPTGSETITVDGCTATGTSVVTGIYLEYASNWQISNTTLSGYHHGIEWWGGDSNPQRDGDLANPRLTQRGLINKVTVSHVTEGGIWGSMGDGITVSNCRVTNCGDVGIDFEGCFNSRAINNSVSNCRNGALATFHFNKGIVFSNNTVSQNNAAWPLARIYNAAQIPSNRDVTFTGNSFTATAGVGIINQNGPAQSIRFSNNKLNNVVLDLAFNNNQLLQIDRNTFNITRRAPQGFILRAGSTNNNGRVIIENNALNCTTALNTDITGIYVTQFDYNTSPVNLISNNTFTGIKRQYKVEWTGQNAGVISKTYISTPQKLKPDAIEKAGQSKSPSEVYLNGIKL